MASFHYCFIYYVWTLNKLRSKNIFAIGSSFYNRLLIQFDIWPTPPSSSISTSILSKLNQVFNLSNLTFSIRHAEPSVRYFIDRSLGLTWTIQNHIVGILILYCTFQWDYLIMRITIFYHLTFLDCFPNPSALQFFKHSEPNTDSFSPWWGALQVSFSFSLSRLYLSGVWN